MILVDIQTPMLDRVYDFELDEELAVKILTEDIKTLIAGQEELACEDSGDMYLYAMRQGNILRGEETLKQQGVRDGDRLILI